VKLAEIERHVLNVEREHDLPVSEAPARYFEYLESRSFDVMEDVFRHNLLDVCSLVALCVKISHLIDGVAEASGGRTHLALATWFDAWHDIQAAGIAYRNAVNARDADWRSFWLYSLFLKRQGALEEAASIWTTLADQAPGQPEPAIELAKYYEHHVRDFAAALAIVEKTLNQHGVSPPLAAALEYRLARIQRKLAQQCKGAGWS
jgi:hypothetical protein